jgi:hypothetical protein
VLRTAQFQLVSKIDYIMRKAPELAIVGYLCPKDRDLWDGKITYVSVGELFSVC